MAKFDFSKFPTFLRPRLRLFLSVDLVGSTALKQSSRLPLPAPESGWIEGGGGPHWLAPISDFYLEFAERFETNWRTRTEKKNLPTGENPTLWKANGDELIYIKDLNNRLEIYSCISCWIDSVKQYRSERLKSARLDIKATAWTPGFPVFNTEVVFFSNVSQAKYAYKYDSRLRHFELLDLWHSQPHLRPGLIRDFIGPSIDTGFRLTTLSTTRRMVISLDIAWLLATASLPGRDDQDFASMHMRYGGQRELKGVFSGRPYPFFWLDIMSEDKLTLAEDALLEVPRYPSSDQVRKYCQAFYEFNKTSVIQPFLIDDDYPYTDIPERYSETLEFWKSKIESETTKYKTETEPEPAGLIDSAKGKDLVAQRVRIVREHLRLPANVSKKSKRAKPK